MFSEIFEGEKSLYQLIQELKPKTKIKETYRLHLDPDLRREWQIRAENWKPVFGQQKQALSHLDNMGIKDGDIFLFFGWFRQTELNRDNELRYIQNAPDLHGIYGYFQIGTQFRSVPTLPDRYRNHPHALYSVYPNCIFEASDKLSLDENLPGAGTFFFHPDLVLTKPGLTRSKWKLPEFFKELSISYHNRSSHKDEYFESAKKGQEFVIEQDKDVELWALNIIHHGTSPNSR